MMKSSKEPVTQAVRVLRAAGVHFEGHLYAYVEGGGTAQVARELGLDAHQVIKTLIMEDERANPLIVLMHGDRQVSTQSLARAVGARRIAPCEPKVAERHTGYRVGGTRPSAPGGTCRWSARPASRHYRESTSMAVSVVISSRWPLPMRWVYSPPPWSA